LTEKDFEDRIAFGAQDACWEWQAARLKSGYGNFHSGGKKWRAHRYAYQHFVGDIGRFHVLHRCDNPPCCNPAHLFLGTPADNAKDKALKGRTGKEKRRGEMNVRAKLTDVAVTEIRASAETGGELARRLGVSRTLVNMVRRREIWRHV
jgi:hypothetical protein